MKIGQKPNDINAISGGELFDYNIALSEINSRSPDWKRAKVVGPLAENPDSAKTIFRRFINGVGAAEHGGCWTWGLSCTPFGHPLIKIRGYGYCYAHRVSYVLFRGAIPDGLLVCHECDNPRCVNPNHLSTGDYKKNTRDCCERGRKAVVAMKGESNPSSKLTIQQVREIKGRLATGLETHRSISQDYGVSRAAISLIHRGEKWVSVSL